MDLHLKNFTTYLDIERGFSKNTIAAYNTHLSRFILFAKHKNVFDVKNIDHKLIDDFLLHLQSQKIGHSSQRLFVYAMRTFLHFLVYDEVIKTNFLKHIHIPQVKPTEQPVLTITEIERLFKQPDLSTAKGACHRAILELLYGSGLRISEACDLKIKDLHEDYVKVMGKGNKERIVPLGAMFLDCLHHYWKEFRDPETLLPDNYIFTSKGILPIKRSQMNQALGRYAIKANLTKRVTPHILRHTFASHLLSHGTPFPMVQEFLGHSSIETTARYTHIEFDQVVESFKKFHPRYDSLE